SADVIDEEVALVGILGEMRRQRQVALPRDVEALPIAGQIDSVRRVWREADAKTVGGQLRIDRGLQQLIEPRPALRQPERFAIADRAQRRLREHRASDPAFLADVADAGDT